jgi:hypothetical protein
MSKKQKPTLHKRATKPDSPSPDSPGASPVRPTFPCICGHGRAEHADAIGACQVAPCQCTTYRAADATAERTQ